MQVSPRPSTKQLACRSAPAAFPASTEAGVGRSSPHVGEAWTSPQKTPFLTAASRLELADGAF